MEGMGEHCRDQHLALAVLSKAGDDCEHLSAVNVLVNLGIILACTLTPSLPLFRPLLKTSGTTTFRMPT